MPNGDGAYFLCMHSEIMSPNAKIFLYLFHIPESHTKLNSLLSSKIDGEDEIDFQKTHY